MSLKLSVIIFSSAAFFVISYSYYKSSMERELNEAKFYITKRQENIYRKNLIRFTKMCAFVFGFQTAKPSIFKVLLDAIASVGLHRIFTDEHSPCRMFISFVCI